MPRSSGIPQPNPPPWSPPRLRPAPLRVRPQQPGEETDLPFTEHHHMARVRLAPSSSSSSSSCSTHSIADPEGKQSRPLSSPWQIEGD
ncbi:hypothetical protein ACLOJK_006478 [Asimina triloba]